MEREGARQADQRQEHDLTAPPALGRDRRARSRRLANLLSAAAVLVAELELDEPGEQVGRLEPRRDDTATATSRTRESSPRAWPTF
ncbi:unnamed protein product [Lampetra planeri]